MKMSENVKRNYTVSELERICIYNIYTYVAFIYIMYKEIYIYIYICVYINKISRECARV